MSGSHLDLCHQWGVGEASSVREEQWCLGWEWSSLHVHYSHTSIHKVSAVLRLLPFGIFCRPLTFLGMWLEYSAWAWPIFTLVGGAWMAFPISHVVHYHVPEKKHSFPCIWLTLSLMLPRWSAPTSQNHTHSRGTKLWSAKLLPSPSHFVSRKLSPLWHYGTCRRQHFCSGKVLH